MINNGYESMLQAWWMSFIYIYIIFLPDYPPLFLFSLFLFSCIYGVSGLVSMDTIYIPLFFGWLLVFVYDLYTIFFGR